MENLDLDADSSSVEKAYIVHNFFNVHSVLTIIFNHTTDYDLTDVLISYKEFIWEVFSYTKIDRGDIFQYSAIAYPQGMLKEVKKVTNSSSELISVLSGVRKGSIFEDIKFEYPFNNLRAAYLLVKYRNFKFEQSLSMLDPKTIWSMNNIFLYVHNKSLMSMSYKSLFNARTNSVIDLTRKSREFMSAGAEWTYSDQGKLNMYLGFAPERKQTYKVHVATFFTKIVKLRTSLVLDPFVMYKISYSLAGFSSGNWLLFKSIFTSKEEPYYTYYFGVNDVSALP